jgi:site-specific recombinase XerD
MARIRTLNRKPRKPQFTWREAIEQYLYWKKAQGLKDSTIGSIRDVLHIFFNRHPDAWPDRLTEAAYAFLGEKVKAATYNIRLSYLRGFFDWLTRMGWTKENPLAEFKKRRAEGRIVQVDAETLRRLLELPDQGRFAGLRDYALILLSLDTGIRPKEAFSLHPDDINFKAMEVYVRAEEAKTGITRTLPIGPATADAIRRLLAVRPPEWGEGVPVFCTENGTPLNRVTWGDRLEKYSEKLGVKITPYTLRHSFATWALRNGMDAISLQRIMGHADISMTKRYVHLVQEDIREKHAAFSPLGTILKQRHQARARRKIEP